MSGIGRRVMYWAQSSSRASALIFIRTVLHFISSKFLKTNYTYTLYTNVHTAIFNNTCYSNNFPLKFKYINQ